MRYYGVDLNKPTKISTFVGKAVCKEICSYGLFSRSYHDLAVTLFLISYKSLAMTIS